MISCAFFLLHSHVSSCDFMCLRGILVSKLFARVVNTCERGTKSCESDPEETLLYSKVKFASVFTTLHSVYMLMCVAS